MKRDLEEILEMFETIDNKTNSIIIYLLRNRNEKDEVEISLRELSSKLGISFKTCFWVFKLLKEKNKLIYIKSRKVYKLIL